MVDHRGGRTQARQRPGMLACMPLGSAVRALGCCGARVGAGHRVRGSPPQAPSGRGPPLPAQLRLSTGSVAGRTVRWPCKHASARCWRNSALPSSPPLPSPQQWH